MLVFVLGLNPLFFIPLTLVLLLMGIRFTYYPKRARFAFDWTLGSMLLIISASLAEDLAVEVSALSVLLYFVLGIASLILWNAAAEESYRGLGRSIAMFVLIVGASPGLGMVLHRPFFMAHGSVGTFILFGDLVGASLCCPLA